MATTTQGVSSREIARELGVDTKTVSYWVKQGWVEVLQWPEGPGKPMVLDRLSVLACWEKRRKKDKRHKTRVRSRAHPTTHHPTPPHNPPPNPTPQPTTLREGELTIHIYIHLVDS